MKPHEDATREQPFKEVMLRVDEMTDIFSHRKLELEEGVVLWDEEAIKHLLISCKTEILPKAIEQMARVRSEMTRFDSYMAALCSLIQLGEECLALVKSLQKKA